MKSDFILEIGTEELPPSCIREGLNSLKVLLEKNFLENRIKFDSFSSYSSPRRMAIYTKGVSNIQETAEKSITGPPKKIAYDPDGKPNRVAIGFAKNLGIDAEDLEEIEIEGKGIYLGKKMIQEGKKTADILPEILKSTILALTFKKQMYWGDYGTRFIRPIRWLLAIMGSEVIDFKIENIRSGNITFGHRTLSTAPIEIGSVQQYFTKLEQGKAIVDPNSRKKMIYDQIKSIEKDIWNNKYKAIVDEKLLKEVIDLVEIPNVLIGHFPEAFLYIPADILIEAIKYHQKYFPVVDSRGNITTNFLIVQNGIKDNGDIKKGNERVLRARLSDASFFYEQDKKHDFLYWQEKLKGVIFYFGLGNMNEKQKRLGEISIYLAEKINKSDNKKLLKDLKDASAMCKCDLVTNMVVEFPELQGIVGREYSMERGYDESVSKAVFEHYLPESAGDRLPGTETGRIISLADRADTITGMFLMGKIPSGSEDPFALRRKASGMVRSILDGEYDIDLKDLIKFCSSLYKKSYETKESDDNKMIEKIFGFITARLRFLIAASNKKMDVFDAVLGSGCSSLKDIDLRQEAIEDYMSKRDIKSIVWPMSRSQNIITGKQPGPVDPGLFKEKYEKELFEALQKIESSIYSFIEKKEYFKLLEEMSRFGVTVDKFFDEVLVMERDDKIRANRINLLKEVVDLYSSFADFSLIVIDADTK